MPMSVGIGLGVAVGGKPAVFSPLSLAPALWLKADAGAYTDAGTTLATDTQTVQQWNDQSGNGRHVSQATAGNRPTYRTNIQNSLPVIRFDGTDDFLRSAGFTLSQPFTVVTVSIKRTTTGSNSTVWGGVSADVRLIYRSTDQGMELWAGTAEAPSMAVDYRTCHIYTAFFNGASSTIQADAGAATTGNPGANNAGGITVGAKHDNGEPSDEDVCELLAFSGALAAGDLTSLLAYLKARWATP